jgi:branched-chain amino acid transport system substrate-binding protein
VFPYVFTAPATYWSQNTAKLRFIGHRAGGMAQLKGVKIVHVYHDSDYGRETLAILDTQATHYGFTVQHLAVPSPGLDQQATWLRVKVAQPDWVILRSVGVMTATALKAAAQVGVPRDKIVGTSPTCAEQDVVPAGEAAIGFICANWHGTGTHFPLIQEVRKYVYARGKGAGPAGDVGTGIWIGGLLRGHAPLWQPAPDRRAGAVGARTLDPHGHVAQRDGGGGPDLPAHPVLSRS